MQHLRDTDGTQAHRRAARFHLAKCKGGGTPLHAQLRAEAAAVYQDLKAKQRATEDVEDDLVDAAAEADTTEINLENAMRDLDSDLVRFDRDRPGANARLTAFPDGFGALIEPEGEHQLAVLPALRVRLAPYESEPSLLTSIARLNAAEAAFKLSLDAEAAAEIALEQAFAAELAARAAVRAHLVSAHGRLRDLYKARPALAEAYFLKLGRREGKPKAAGKIDVGVPKGGGIGTGGAPPTG